MENKIKEIAIKEKCNKITSQNTNKGTCNNNNNNDNNKKKTETERSKQSKSKRSGSIIDWLTLWVHK